MQAPAPLMLECGLTRTAPMRVRGRALHVVAWRVALGRRGSGRAAATLVMPVALGEQREGRRRWRLVPDLTLAVSALGVFLAAWITSRRGEQGRAESPERARQRRTRG
jgi:hypothetical protein